MKGEKGSVTSSKSGKTWQPEKYHHFALFALCLAAFLQLAEGCSAPTCMTTHVRDSTAMQIVIALCPIPPWLQFIEGAAPKDSLMLITNYLAAVPEMVGTLMSDMFDM